MSENENFPNDLKIELPNISPDNAFEILSDRDVRLIYRQAHQEYLKQAKELQSQLSQSLQDEKSLKKITQIIINSQRFLIEKESVIADIQACQSFDDIVALDKKIKAQVQEIVATLKGAEKKGIALRRYYGIKPPKIFENKSRVYIKIKPILSDLSLLNNLIQWWNDILPQEDKITLNGDQTHFSTYRFMRYKQGTRPVAFVQTLYTQLSFLKNQLAQRPDLLPKLIAFLDTFSKTGKEAQKAFQTFSKEQGLPACRLDTLALYQLKIFAKQKSNFMYLLNKLIDTYQDYHHQLHEIAIKTLQIQKNNSIDMVVFSLLPRDLSQLSTFTNWQSCMSVTNGAFFPDVISQIGAGSIVAFGVNSKNPYEKISRILLRPFVSERSFTHIRMKELNSPEPKPKFDLPPGLDMRLDWKLSDAEALQNDCYSPFYEQKYCSSYYGSSSLENLERVYLFKKMHGLQNPLFSQKIDDFVKQHLNTPHFKKGFVRQPIPFYLDGFHTKEYIIDPNDDDPLWHFLRDIKERSCGGRNSDGTLHVDGEVFLNAFPDIKIDGLHANTLYIRASALKQEVSTPVEVENLYVAQPCVLDKISDNIKVKQKLVVLPSAVYTGPCVMPVNLKVPYISCSCTYVRYISTIPTQVLHASSTPLLTSLPDGLNLEELNINNSAIQKLPDDLVVTESLNVSNTAITELPKSICLTGDLSAQNMPNLSQLPSGMNLKKLNISYCQKIEQLPDDLVVSDTLIISHTPISSLPKTIKNQKLSNFVATASAIQEIGNEYVTLNVSDTPICEIPENFKAVVAIFDRTQITKIPENIEVTDLSCSKTQITTTPHQLNVERLNLLDTPLQFLEYSEKLKKVKVNHIVPYIAPQFSPSVIEGMSVDEVKCAQQRYLDYQKMQHKKTLDAIQTRANDPYTK